MKTKKQRAIKYGISAIVFCAVFVATSAIKAGVSENTVGWAWGGSDNGSNIPSGLGWISMNNTNTGGGVSYGVNIPITGQITGYGYSENVGAIDFNPHSGCPGAPKYAGACDAYPDAPSQDATRNADNTITGWARFVDISKAKVAGISGGWSGWVKLTGSNYGVTIGTDDKLSGYAWSDELGFIDFNGTYIGVITPPADIFKICLTSCNSGQIIDSSYIKNMVVGGIATFKACYNTSSSCDIMTGDVTATATIWAKTNLPNNAVSFTSPGVIKADAVGQEGVSATYNPGTGNIINSFSVKVDPIPCTCDSTTASTVCTTASKFNDSCGNAVCDGTKVCSIGVPKGKWIEVAP